MFNMDRSEKTSIRTVREKAGGPNVYIIGQLLFNEQKLRESKERVYEMWKKTEH